MIGLNIKMPENCYDCPCWNIEMDCCGILHCWAAEKGRLPDCPLVDNVALIERIERVDGKMTVKEFFENENNLVIHCDTKEKAERLLEEFDKAGYRWCTNDRYKYRTSWHIYREETCYSNARGYADIEWYKNEGWQVLEFEEIELEYTLENKEGKK